MWKQTGRGFTCGDATSRYTYDTCMCLGQGQSRGLGHLEVDHLDLRDSFWLFPSVA